MKWNGFVTMRVAVGLVAGLFGGLSGSTAWAGTSLAATTEHLPFACQTGLTVVAQQKAAAASVPLGVTLKNEPAKLKTSARVSWDETSFKVVFDCEDPQIAAKARSRDDPDLWRDDCVEIFFDLGHTHSLDSRWVHIMVNAEGSVFDERGPVTGYFMSGLPEGGSKAFNATGMVVRITRQPPGWLAEITIPWSDLGGSPAMPARWGFNLAREDHPSEENLCSAPTFGSFYNIDRWGHLLLLGPDTAGGDAAVALQDLIAADHSRIKAERDWTQLRDAMTVKSDHTWIDVDGVVYGAKADARGPLGGGPGYGRIATNGDYRVSTLDELLAALGEARSGQVVFVESKAEIDCTARVMIEKLVVVIPAGVTLAGDRGHNGSPGALIFSDEFKTAPLISVTGAHARVTGLRLRGPDLLRRLDHSTRAGAQSGTTSDYYYKFPLAGGIQTKSPGLEVDNCELSGWSESAVYLIKGAGHHIHHNYLHHNQHDGSGYGVALDEAEALIEQNLFDCNRHSVAGTGRVPSGYEACDNVELGGSQGLCFDMHGGADRKDGTELAGTWLKIHHNTVLHRSIPVGIRGVPERGAEVHHNWFPFHRPVLSSAETLNYLTDSAVTTLGNTRIYSNAYCNVEIR